MATSSRFNQPYRGGIAGRGPTPVGRSPYDLQRVAEQQYRQTGSPRLLMSMDFRNQMQDRMQSRRQAPSLPPAPASPMPAPQMPGGRLVPGRSMGSQVWQADTPADAIPTMPEQQAGMPALLTAPDSRMPSAPMGDGMMPQSNTAPFQMPMLPPALTPQGGLDITQPLPASTLGGGAGVPLPPAFETQTIGGFDVLKQNTPEGMKYLGMKSAPPPMISTAGLRMLGDYNAKNPDKQLMPTGQFEPNGQPILAPKPVGDGKAPAFKYETDVNGRITGAVYPVQDPQTGQWKLNRADLNGDGVVSAAEAAQAGGGKAGGAYFDNLLKPPAGQAQPAAQAPAAAPMTPTTAMGQMPNVAYANDMQPPMPEPFSSNPNYKPVPYAADFVAAAKDKERRQQIRAEIEAKFGPAARQPAPSFFDGNPANSFSTWARNNPLMTLPARR